jgi:hypothetical protein
MTVFSARELRVCCTPQPTKGSPRFLRPGSSAARRQHGRPLAFLAKRFTPFEDFPHQQPYRITAAVALLSSLPATRHTAGRGRSVPIAPSRGPTRTAATAALRRERDSGDARTRFECDDAPIRRSGPPRHRARLPRPGQSRTTGSRVTTSSRTAPKRHSETGDRVDRRRGLPTVRSPQRARPKARRPSTLTAIETAMCAANQVRRTPKRPLHQDPSEPREAADFRALLR